MCNICSCQSVNLWLEFFCTSVFIVCNFAGDSFLERSVTPEPNYEMMTIGLYYEFGLLKTVLQVDQLIDNK